MCVSFFQMVEFYIIYWVNWSVYNSVLMFDIIFVVFIDMCNLFMCLCLSIICLLLLFVYLFIINAATATVL